MRKLLTFTFLVLIFTGCNAQFKVGNLSVDSTTFFGYITYCYTHPDTTLEWETTDFLWDADPHRTYAQIQAIETEKDTMPEITDGEITFYYPTKPNRMYDGKHYDAAEAKAKHLNEQARKDAIAILNAGPYNAYTFYVTPQQPTEAGLIKFLNLKKWRAAP